MREMTQNPRRENKGNTAGRTAIAENSYHSIGHST